jgi:hypothetical protein
LADVDLRQLAKKVRAAGRGRDTVLAHITPAEAKLLKARGGRGSVNPKTGLPEFEDDFYDFGGGADYGGGGDYGGGQDASGDYETPQPSFATETVPGGQEFDPSMRAGTETLSASALTPQQQAQDARRAADIAALGQGITPEQQGRADEAVAAIRSPDFFAGTPDLTSDQLETYRNAFSAINQPNFLGDTSPGLLQRLTSGLGLGNISGTDLARLGLAGAGVGMGVQARNAALNAARKAQTDIQGIGDTSAKRADNVRTDLGNVSVNIASRAEPVKADFQALAEPYQKQGRELIQAALSGTLSPASAQTYQAAEARMKQAQSRSGGVGAAQGVAQLETLRQSLLSNQYQEGLKVQQYGDQLARQGITTGLAQANLGSAAEADAIKSALAAAGISDTYTLRAIQAGLAGNTEASRLSAGYFQALGSILGGTPALARTLPAATTTPGA